MEQSGPSLGLTPRLETRPGLRHLSFLALLPASAVELDAAIERAVEQNPLLERQPWRTCPTCGLATTADRCAACAAAHWATDPEDAVDWRSDLIRDAAPDLSADLRPYLELVVAMLDDRGLLPVAPEIRPDVLDLVINGIRGAGPPGIAATSPVDCVRVQAAALVATGAVPALVSEVGDHWLPEVAEERYADVAAATSATEAAVRAAVDLLRARTRPYVVLPGTRARSAPTDVVFTQPERGGPVVVHVLDAAAAGVGRVTDLCADSAEARAWIAPHRDAADRLVAAIAARGQMLRRVADVLSVRQRAFILDGPAAHAPLRRHELAAVLDVHPSTVGRVVSGKVARCPDGRLVSLSGFFGAAASTQVRVAAAIESHPGATDREVAELLSRGGPAIARRTVAKYRALVANPTSPVC